MITPNIASTIYLKEKKRRTKIATSCYFLTGMHNFLSMQRYEVPADSLAPNYSERVKYLHPVLILIKIGVLVRKKNAPKMTIFYLLEKSVPPLTPPRK